MDPRSEHIFFKFLQLHHLSKLTDFFLKSLLQALLRDILHLRNYFWSFIFYFSRDRMFMKTFTLFMQKYWTFSVLHYQIYWFHISLESSRIFSPRRHLFKFFWLEMLIQKCTCTVHKGSYFISYLYLYIYLCSIAINLRVTQLSVFIRNAVWLILQVWGFLLWRNCFNSYDPTPYIFRGTCEVGLASLYPLRTSMNILTYITCCMEHDNSPISIVSDL